MRLFGSFGPSSVGIETPPGVVWNIRPMTALPLVVGSFRMSNHRTAVAIFAIVLVAVITIAFVTTLHGVDTTQVAKNDMPPGVTALSQPHTPLDTAPGKAVLN
jgi:hypothetical protein